MTNINPIRPSPIAGTWYPGNPDILRDEVAGYTKQAAVPRLDGKIVGILVPHAGYRYSGPTAGYAYRCVEGMSFEQVVVISPLHEYLPHSIMTSAHKYYATPLGTVPIDHESIEKLSDLIFKHTGNKIVAISNDQEHSLEIQLPFLQCVLAAPFELIPLMIREQKPALLQHFGEALAEAVHGKKVLLVASTDLSHFYPEQEANFLDKHMLEAISSFDPAGVLRAEAKGTGFACGSGAVATVLWAAKALGASKITVLHHSTSADSTGDSSQVVGYAAAAILV